MKVQENIWARLYVNHDDESVQAVKTLRNKGLHVTVLPVSGLPGPELKIDRTVYKGLHEIQQFVEGLEEYKTG